MAGQGLFLRNYSLVSSCRLLINNRLPQVQVTQTAGVKHKFTDQLINLKVPDKPKRPPSPYFKFFQERRNLIIKQHPQLKITEISSQCGSEWQQLDPEEKRKYEEGYKQELEEYKDKYLSFMNKLSSEQKKALEQYDKDKKRSKVRRQLNKKKREFNKPKRPISAYLRFVMEKVKLDPKKHMFDHMKEYKEEWSNLPDAEKQKYIVEAKKEFEKFEEELNQWEKKMIAQGETDVVRKITMEKITEPKSNKQKPKGKEVDE